PTATSPLSLHDALPISTERDAAYDRWDTYWSSKIDALRAARDAGADAPDIGLEWEHHPDTRRTADEQRTDARAWLTRHRSILLRDRKSTRLNSSHVKIS